LKIIASCFAEYYWVEGIFRLSVTIELKIQELWSFKKLKTIANDPRVRHLWCAAILIISLLVAGNTIAETIVTGQLTYDSNTSIITGSNGNSYLGFEIAGARDYNYVQDIILTDPLYSGYHVASQAEAYEFYNLAIDPLTLVIDTEDDQEITTIIDGIRDRFGNIQFRDYRHGNYAPAFFLSDVGDTNVGVILSYDGSIVIDDNWGDLNRTYYHSYGYGHSDYYSWLIVKPDVTFTDSFEE